MPRPTIAPPTAAPVALLPALTGPLALFPALVGVDTVISTRGSRQIATPIGAPIRVRTHLGDGVLVYATDDAYLGVQLDGEQRVDEYPAQWVATLLEVA